MFVYVLLCDSKVPTAGGLVETKKVFQDVFENMFTAKRAIVDYYLPPNLVRLPHREEDQFRHKEAIYTEVYTDRSQSGIYNFYVIARDLEQNKD